MARKILVIDDDPDVVLALRMPLESAGYEVHEANSQSEGMVKVAQVLPDLIILDVMMDSHTAGFQLAQDLHGPDANEEYKRIPILMLTAVHTTTPLRFKPDPDYLPVEAFVEKPVKPDKLLEQVARLLQAK
jgi:CheY-like chemotaxis protein